MTALEEYTAHHSESAEDIMYRWGWRRFEGMFRRHLMRKAREELRQMRDLRLAAMDANTNFDSKDNQQAKQSRSDALQQAYTDGIKIIYSDAPVESPPDDYDTDPLFAPIRRRAEALAQEVNQPLVKQAGMGQQLLEDR